MAWGGMLIYEKTIAVEDTVENMPVGSLVIIQASANFTIAFWNPLTDAFDPATAVTAPGGVVGVPHNIAKIVGATSVRIVGSN